MQLVNSVQNKKNSGKVWFRWCVMVGREDAKKEVILVYSLVICLLWILIQFAKRS